MVDQLACFMEENFAENKAKLPRKFFTANVSSERIARCQRIRNVKKCWEFEDTSTCTAQI